MKIYKKIALASLFMLPMMAQASGIGIYVPMAVTTSSSTKEDKIDYTEDIEYKSGVGFGVAYDTNVGMDEMFAYRLGLEYMKIGIDNINGNSYSGEDYTRLNMVNTFEFGLVTSKNIRFWIGPRINIAYQGITQTSGTQTYDETKTEFGIAPALGTSFNLGSTISLGLDVDYRYAGLISSWNYKDSFDNSSSDGTNSGSAKGLTARFYLMFRFGEGGSVASAPTTDDTTPSSDYPESDNVIDESL